MMVKKRVLFLYGNRPENLPINIIKMLNGTEIYEVRLVYLDRIKTPVSLPMSGILGKEKCIPVKWPVGNNKFSKIINRFIILARFIKIIIAYKPDAIHAWNIDMLLAAKVASKMLPNSKILFTLQDTTEWMLRPIILKVQRCILRDVDSIFVTSKQFETKYLRRFGLINEKTKVNYVPNVPMASLFSDFQTRQIKRDLVVGYIGLFRGKEGINCLVEATKIARQKGQDVKLLFVGTGLERDLVAKIANENKEFIIYEGPYRHDRDIKRLYARVDVLYAIYEKSYDKQIHLAYRLCEAINCSLPTIVAKNTHMAEIVEKYRIGSCVALGNENELASALIELSNDQNSRQLIARNCKNIRYEFEFEHYAEEIRSTYERLWNLLECQPETEKGTM